MPWATPSRRSAQAITGDAIARVRVMALRVVFAEDNYLVRQGVTSLLTEVEDIDVVAVATDLASLLDAVAETSADGVPTVIRMPPTHTKEGIEAEADPVAAPGRRRRGLLPVRRGGLRLRAAGRRRR